MVFQLRPTAASAFKINFNLLHSPSLFLPSLLFGMVRKRDQLGKLSSATEVLIKVALENQTK
jgi:hypothetical protein